MAQPPVTIGKRTPFEGAVEWCFKFNNGEPVVFGVSETPESLKIDIPAEAEANIVFSTADGQTFEIFPRNAVKVETTEVLEAEDEQQDPA